MRRASRHFLSLACVLAVLTSPCTPYVASNYAKTASEPRFHSYDEAIRYVRSHYRGESIDTSRSSWITSAEYYPAEGRGYLILGMRGNPYIFARVPTVVWEEFTNAPSLGRYYNQRIKGRYRFEL